MGMLERGGNVRAMVVDGRRKKELRKNVRVEPYHLFRYINEQACRFNTRRMTDGERFESVVSEIGSRRLTYVELTGKIGETETIN